MPRRIDLTLMDARKRLALVCYNETIRHLPGRFGGSLRRFFLVLAGARIAKDCIIGRGVRVLGAEKLSIATDASVARDVILDARGGVTLQAGALIGLESVILSHTHNYSDVSIPVQHQGMWSAPVTLGAGCWLGARVQVMPGVTVGRATIVGAGAVVVKPLPDQVVAAGVPAVAVRERG